MLAISACPFNIWTMIVRMNATLQIFQLFLCGTEGTREVQSFEIERRDKYIGTQQCPSSWLCLMHLQCERGQCDNPHLHPESYAVHCWCHK